MASSPATKLATSTGSQGAPNLVTTPPMPTPDDPATKAAMDAAKAEQARSRGRASTILTGGLGLMDKPVTASRVLLGN